MSEHKIARTIAEAEVGDFLWQYDMNANGYDEKRKYLGRGVWSIVSVSEVRRQYLRAGHYDYNRKTGIGRSEGGFSSSMSACGSQERLQKWWLGQDYTITNAVRACRDVETLKTIAFALGLEGPPDFSRLPTQAEEAALPLSPARKEDADA